MADIDYDRLSEAIADAISRSNNSQAEDKAKDIIKKQDEQAAKALMQLTKSLKDASGAGKVFDRWLKGQSSSYNSLQRELESLEDQINATTNAEEQKKLITNRTTLETAQRLQNLNSAIENASLGFAKMTMQMSNSVASATGGFIKGVQGGQSSFALSAGLMSGAVDIANQGVQAAAGGLQGVGQIAAGSTNPKLRGLGIAAQFAGVGVSMLGNQASRLAKFGIEVLSKELEKTIGAYQRTSASGALFVDGLQGMRNAAGDAGLTVDQFANVISRNSGTLASSGLGVGEATRRLGQVGKVLKEQGIDKQLLRLGYGFEEQAELTAEVMSDMRRANSSALLDPNQIAKSTQEYATNLRTIAAITGEDAKKKMEETRRLAAQTAVRIKLQELEGKQKGVTEKYLQAMTTMPAAAQKAINQLMAGEAVTGTEAVQMAVDPTFQRLVEGTVAQLKSGKFSVEENQQLQGKENDAFLKNLKDNKDIGTAFIFGKLSDLNQNYTDRIQNADKATQAAFDDARTRAEGQQKTPDKLTESYINAAVEAQKFAIKLQTLFDPFIESYATVTSKMLEEINKTFDLIKAEITKEKAGGKNESAWEKTKRIGGAALNSASTVAGIASLPVMASAATGIGVVPTAIVAAGATVAAGLVGGINEWFKGKEGKSGGGVARGSASGYLEKLHGPEAVVPLPDGKTIPVNIQTPLTVAMAPEEPKPVPATVAVPKEPEPQPVPAVNVTLAVPKAAPAPPVDVTIAMPKEASETPVPATPAVPKEPVPPVPITPAVPKEPEPAPIVTATPAVPKEPEPAFATQKTVLSGVENIENMARSFVERPTDRLDAGFAQFLSDLKITLDTANVLQAKQPEAPVPTEVPMAVTLKETIEQTSAVLSDLMREHTSIMKESLAKVTDLVSVSSDAKYINQQILHNSY